MIRVMSDAEIEESNRRDREMFAALSPQDKVALASIRYRLRNADDADALAHFVRGSVNGIDYAYADSQTASQGEKKP